MSYFSNTLGKNHNFITSEKKSHPEPNENQNTTKRQLVTANLNPKNYQCTPTAILPSNVSTKTNANITSRVNTGQPGWEERFQIIAEAFLKFESDTNNSTKCSAANDID